MFANEISMIMTASQGLRSEIHKRVENLSSNQLQELLIFLISLEKDTTHIEKVLSFAGIFKELDDEVFDDFTTNLHENRMASTREIDSE
jgi:hypothetical protein